MELPSLSDIRFTPSPTKNPTPLVASASEADIASLLLSGQDTENLPKILEHDSSENASPESTHVSVPTELKASEENTEEQESYVAAVLLEVSVSSPTMNEEATSQNASAQVELHKVPAVDVPEPLEPSPNYPPVIYPAIDDATTPCVVEHGVDERMDVDTIVSHEFIECEGMGQDEDEDDDKMDEDEDKIASEISNGEDLLGDLETALDGDFGFKGSFSYASTLPTAPNPCLFIVGLGLVGLPLSERDAKLIIGCSAQAPYGHGERTVVNTDVRDTWEIEPAKIRFGNPAWEPYVQDLAVKSVCQVLGVGPSATPPRCELYKLLLYEQGSHFLPHQDTQKADGMFATVIILLPSAYSGGQVQVSHASVKKVFDLSSDSLSTSAILAWYTDVMHEVKPVTAGYRLALSYNLIQSNPGIPLPILPDMNHAVTYLRQVLRKWNKGVYSDAPESDNLVAYILKHQYSEVNLRSGIRSLKGEDAHRVANLKDVAEELGYMVCLANLDHNITGSGDDDYGYNRNRYGGWKRQRYNYYSDSEDDDDDGPTPSMGEVSETNTTIKHLVDLDGNLLRTSDFSIGDDCLIPRDPFQDVDPDDEDYEGYMGNGAGQLDYWYHRTVLVLFHEDEAPSFLHSGGTHYALHKLQKSTVPPSTEDRQTANLILHSLRSHDSKTSITMAEYALKWNDAAMWKAVINGSGKNLEIFDVDKLIQAWQRFSFANVRQIFEDRASQIARLKDRLGFIQSLPLHAPPAEQDIVAYWCREQSILALSSHKSPAGDDVPVLLQAWKQFSFETVRPSLEAVASHITRLKERLDFTRMLPPHALDGEQDDVKNWCREQCVIALSSHKSPTVGDVPALVQAWKQFSFESIRTQFEAVASSISLLKDRLDFIQTLPSHASDAEQDVVKNWYREQSVIALSSQNLLTVRDVPALIQVWKEFSFETVRTRFENVVSHITGLKERLDFIQTLSPHASPAEKVAVNDWCEKLYKTILMSYKSPTVEDVPVLISVACEKGITYVNHIVLSRLSKAPSSYSFWVALIKTLQENRVRTLQSHEISSALAQGSQETPIRSTAEAFNSVLDQCLDAAVTQWDDVPKQTSYPTYTPYYSTQQNTQPQQTKIARVIELVELCLWTGRMNACRKLFVLLLKNKEDTSRKFLTLYIPLIPKLKEVLNKKKVDICSTPFIDLMQLLVGTYLRDMLGAKGRNPRPKSRKIGCGCADCNLVDSFMNSSHSKEQTFRMAMARRTHLEGRLKAASDLVKFVTIRTGSPHGVMVTKLPDVIAASQWDGRQAQARVFLKAMGSSDLLSKIMGSRYQDVLKAVDGSQPFVLTVNDAAASGQAPVASSSRGSAVVTGASPFTAPSTTQPFTTLLSVPPASMASSSVSMSAMPSSAPALSSNVAASSATPSITPAQGMPSTVRPQTSSIGAVAGVKRKKGAGRQAVQLGPVIDLTGDDSS